MQIDTSMHRRSLLKGFSWEALSTILTFGLAWLVFGRIIDCLVFAVACFVIKLILFYIHERIWHQIPYGKKQNRD